MKVPYNWLKEYINVKLPPEKLAELLTMAGLSVESIQKAGLDHVLEIEITANRPDWLSMIGVAREVAALTGGKLKIPSPAKIRGKGQGLRVKVRIEDKSLCPRYTARPIYNVKVGESPAWLKERLEAMGLRPVNNIVDITNFCLFETGEPMHAFDLDKISGGEVIIRKARRGEKLIVIEGAEKSLEGSELVIADKDRPIAIAGVMGGLSTEVTSSTKNILLEAAFFDPISIRRASRKLGISTESSYRFERRVDINNIAYASDRALGLILELAGGQAGPFIDAGLKKAKETTINVKYDHVNKVLGTELSPSEIKKIASSLDMKEEKSSKDTITLKIPSFRYDLKAEIDVIEEVSRIYGYAKIPTTLPQLVEQPIRIEKDLAARNKILQILIGLGNDEIITYSLLGRKMMAAAELPDEEIVEVQNPLTTEQEVMRTSLIPGMLNAAMWNINRKTKDLRLFEMGNIYFKKPDGEYGEKRSLCIGMAGEVFASWAGGSRAASFYELKGIAEALLAELAIENTSFRHAVSKSFLSSECAGIYIGPHPIGMLGEVSPVVLNNFGIKEKVYVLEMDVESLITNAVMEKRFAELPRFPSVYRDISIVAGKDNLNSDVISAIKAAAGTMLKDARLIDRYEGKQIPEGKVSLTYRLEYRDLKKTLEEKDVLETHSRVLRSLEEKLGAKLR